MRRVEKEHRGAVRTGEKSEAVPKVEGVPDDRTLRLVGGVGEK